MQDDVFCRPWSDETKQSKCVADGQVSDLRRQTNAIIVDDGRFRHEKHAV